MVWFCYCFLLQIAMAKVLEQGPVMVLTFQAQQLTRKHDGDSFSVSETHHPPFSVFEGFPSKIGGILFDL